VGGSSGHTNRNPHSHFFGNSPPTPPHNVQLKSRACGLTLALFGSMGGSRDHTTRSRHSIPFGVPPPIKPNNGHVKSSPTHSPPLRLRCVRHTLRSVRQLTVSPYAPSQCRDGIISPCFLITYIVPVIYAIRHSVNFEKHEYGASVHYTSHRLQSPIVIALGQVETVVQIERAPSAD